MLVVAFVAVAAALLAVVAVRDDAGTGPGGSTPLAATSGPTPGTDPDDDTVSGAESTTTTVVAGPEEITLLFGGDLLPHGPVNNRAATNGAATGVDYDYAPMFEPVRPIIEGADIAICHMEVPSAPDGEQVTSYPSFGAPPELVDGAHAAGYDGCSTASNHSLDRGQAGLARLLEQFDARGMEHAGTARSQEEAETTTIYDVDGVRVANLSYAYDFNGYRLPDDAPWAANRIDVDAIQAAASQARADGADLVVLSLHFGNEYQHDPSDYQRDVVDQLLPSDDISVIIGHHAHVVQPIERVEGTFVVWGLGNQVSNQSELPRRDGLMVRLDAARDEAGDWSVATVEAIPTFVDLSTYEIHPVVEALADPATPAGLRDQLSASYDRTAEVLARTPTDGVALAPKP